MISPVPGMAFVIEARSDAIEGNEKLKEIGFSASDAHQRNKGIEGTIYAVNESHLCTECGSKCQPIGLKKGDRVLYSKFIAEQIEMTDEGKKIDNLRSVPVNGILAILS